MEEDGQLWQLKKEDENSWGDCTVLPACIIHLGYRTQLIQQTWIIIYTNWEKHSEDKETAFTTTNCFWTFLIWEMHQRERNVMHSACIYPPSNTDDPAHLLLPSSSELDPHSHTQWPTGAASSSTTKEWAELEQCGCRQLTGKWKGKWKTTTAWSKLWVTECCKEESAQYCLQSKLASNVSSFELLLFHRQMTVYLIRKAQMFMSVNAGFFGGFFCIIVLVTLIYSTKYNPNHW